MKAIDPSSIPPSPSVPFSNTAVGGGFGISERQPREASFRFADALRLVIKHAFWVLLCSIVVPIAVTLWTQKQKKTYEATTSILFELGQTKTLGKNVDVFDPYSEYLNHQELMETEFKIITSMRVARQVVIDAALDTDRGFLEDAFPGVSPEKIKPEVLADTLRSRIKIEAVKGTHLANVRFEDNDPARAQRLVSTIVDTYMRLSSEDATGTTGAALEWLNQQLGKLQRELDESENKLHAFKVDRNLVSVALNDQSNMLREEISAFNQAVTAASIKRAQLVSRADALSKITISNPDNVPASEFLNNSTLQQLRTTYLTARTELATLAASGKMENYPEVKVAREKLDSALNSFVHELRNIQLAALRDASVVTAETGNLRNLLDSSRAHALDLNLQEIEYNRLHRAAASNEKLYQNVLERMKEVDLSRMISVKNIKVLDPPLLPGAAIRPKVGLNAGIGAAVGLFLGLAVAFLRELSDRTVKTTNDIEAKLGITSLGILPESYKSKGRKRTTRRRGNEAPPEGIPELLVHNQPNSSMAEAARFIRSNVLFMSPDHPPRVLLVTSPGPGEGKTTIATALATTFAQAGARVLLIDLDLRRPRIHRLFEMGSEQGITTVLLGDPLQAVIRPTSIPNLSVLPAGPIPPNPAELLMSEKLHELLQQLGRMYDRVIIDSPPINPITDAVILSTRVDGTVFVVRAFKTTIDQIRHAYRSLADVKAHLLGVVLNGVDLDKLEYKYSYYYRYYGGYPRTEPSRSKGIEVLS